MRDSPQLTLRAEAICLNVRPWSHTRSLRSHMRSHMRSLPPSLLHCSSKTQTPHSSCRIPPVLPWNGSSLITYAKETTLSTDCLYGKTENPLWFQTLKFHCDRCCHGRRVSEPPITASRTLINTVRRGKGLPRQNLFTLWWAKSLPWVSGTSKSGSALEGELGSKGSSRIGRVEALLTLGTFLEHPGKRS